MPAVLIPDVPFSLRLRMRERVLAWISRDTGLCDFLLPDSVAATWTPEKKQEWMNAIIDNFLHTSTATVGGKEARKRALSCELAGNLRRGCISIRNRSVTHFNIAKMGIMLEGLWDIVSVDLDDMSWARCSLLFDTALIALRVSYLWVYLKDQAPDTELPIDVRKELFQTLVKSFFTSRAPTDNKQDKHSANFKDLLEVWRKELYKYLEDGDFEKKIARLEQTQSLDETVTCVESFLNTLDVDKSWMLDMYHLENDLRNGHLLRKEFVQQNIRDKARRSKGSVEMENGRQMAGKVYPTGSSLPTARQDRGNFHGRNVKMGINSESSFEPAAIDSDFNPDSDVEEEEPPNSDDHESSEDNIFVQPEVLIQDEEDVRRSPRSSPRTKGIAKQPQAHKARPSTSKSASKSRKRRNISIANDGEPPKTRPRTSTGQGGSPRKLRSQGEVSPIDEDVTQSLRTRSGRRSMRLNSLGGSGDRSEGEKRIKTRAERMEEKADAEGVGNESDGGNATAVRRSTRGEGRDKVTPLSRATRRRLLSAALSGEEEQGVDDGAPSNRRRSLRSSRQK